MKNIVIFLNLLILFSCGSRNDEINIETTENSGYFKAKIEEVEKTVKNDGNTHYVKWKKSKDDRNGFFYQVSVYGYDQGFYFDYIIYADQIEIGKEYIYQHSYDFSNLQYEIKYSETCGAPTCSSYWGTSNVSYGIPTGKITISFFDGKIMSGKVEAKVNHQYSGLTENQTRTITKGVFVNAEKAFGSL